MGLNLIPRTSDLWAEPGSFGSGELSRNKVVEAADRTEVSIWVLPSSGSREVLSA